MSRKTRRAKPARKNQHFLESLETRIMLSVSPYDFQPLQPRTAFVSLSYQQSVLMPTGIEDAWESSNAPITFAAAAATVNTSLPVGSVITCTRSSGTGSSWRITINEGNRCDIELLMPDGKYWSWGVNRSFTYVVNGNTGTLSISHARAEVVLLGYVGQIPYYSQQIVEQGTLKFVFTFSSDTTGNFALTYAASIGSGLNPSSGTFSVANKPGDTTGGGGGGTGDPLWDRFASTDPPDAPTNVQMTSYNPAKKTGTLTWNYTSRATGYKIMYSNDGGSTWTTKTITSVMQTSLKLTGISPDAIIRVYATSSKGTSTYTQIRIVKDLPNAPTNVRVLSDYNPAKKTGTVAWNAVANATGYVVLYSNDGGRTWKTKNVKNVTSTKLTGITPDAIIRVFAKNAWGTSITYSQAPAIVKDMPKTPTNAKISNDYNQAKKTGTLTWNAVSNATGYTIMYSINGGATWKTKKVKNVMSVKLTGIAPGAIIRVYATNAWGISTGYSQTTIV